jgi:hypothetical protein
MLETDLAQMLVGPRPSEDQIAALADWKTDTDRKRKSLQNAHGKPLWKDMCEQRVPAGGDKPQWRWFLPEAERNSL